MFKKSSTPHWEGVFPAITTQMHRDGSLDLESTARHSGALIESGVTGLVYLGSLGENQSMSSEKKNGHGHRDCRSQEKNAKTF